MSLNSFNLDFALNLALNASKKAYSEGNYEIFEHTRMGVNISLFIEIPGIKNKLG